ncbi:M1 family metallopeptidase [Actinocrispum wychmicini]|uniref:Aminopeptidase N n=1 Tax=Actinocrispum wychmicini TaxID=1213861 RepID=A0A4R2JED4_9PSEU|nr:M1 family metallopeptidase [Actinocrispum wychmicini]TCO58013.1 peptidase M1-like protein [Actinocrispum wychmicini]
MSRARLAILLALACSAVVGCSSSSPTPAPTPPAPNAGSDGAGDPYYPKDGNGGYDVTAYDVAITYDPSSQHLDGDTTVTASATQDLSRFDLDLTGLDVAGVDIDGTAARFTRAGQHELVVTPAATIAKGAVFHARVRYTGKPTTSSDDMLGTTGWQTTQSGGAFVAGEPHSASFWYPANDHPMDKATFKLSAKVPTGWSVISNGREEPSTQDGGWTTFHWVESTKVATYLTTIGIDKWTFERSALPDGTPVVSAFAPGAEDKKAVEARLPEILGFLAEKFGPYPQSAAGGIFLDENIRFSLETQTRPIYARWTDLTTVVHENAHQWFGDSVSVAGWTDICLNECFASYATWLWSETKDHQNLDQHYRDQVTGNKSKVDFWSNKLYGMGAGNEFHGVYDKGPMAMHALRRQIGDDAFAKLLKDWPAAHKEGTATWPQFEEFVGKLVPNQDLRPFFDAWFHQDKIPADQYLYPGSLRG